ncbi:hypothetical protein COA01_23330 [Bacillus cereus]|uniref:hypothetical protein n=1 Tax=Bacillus cereus TaxID=1396 RepID=UPI000BFE3501|nr:hypothetical protein [Bacillus cereus]PGP18678.1 hypothetical protein COA01_23330 [Bacillus cereus]
MHHLIPNYFSFSISHEKKTVFVAFFLFSIIISKSKMWKGVKQLVRYKSIILMIFGIIIAAMSLQSINVEARACNGGSYWDAKTEECTPFAGTDKNKNQLKEEFTKMGNGSDLGTSWAHKAGRLMIIFSVGVSYAVQVVSMITIVYSSYLYTTSDGDLRKVSQAKAYIMYAFGGMFIASFALVISKMLGSAL